MKPSIFTVSHLSFSYGQKEVLKDISFQLPQNHYISLIGPNGSGKTTLLRLLCGYYKIQKGEIFYSDKKLQQMTVKQKAQKFAAVHQSEFSNFDFRTLEYICLGFSPFKSSMEPVTEKELDRAYQLMALTQTQHLAQCYLNQLSGGEKQKILLTRALAQNPSVLFLDEAMSAMDYHGKIQCIKLLKEQMQERDFTVIAIHHDLNMAYLLSDYVIALNHGKIVANGLAKEVMTKDFFADIFQIQTEITKAGFVILDTI